MSAQEKSSLDLYQWLRVISKPGGVQALIAMNQFSASMRQIQQMAGEPETDIAALTSAIGELAEGDEPERGA